MTGTLRIGCLGAGYFSQFHFDGWRRIDRAQLVGVANRDVAKARATGAPAYANVDELLDAARPDILDIITPPETHAEAIRQGLAAGVRAIICQKPFCRDLDEAREMARAAAAAGIPLVVHENFRFQPWYRAIRAAIDAGAVGTPLNASFRMRTGDGQGPRAYLDRQPYFQKMPRLLVHETAVHWIDTFRYLFDEPATVYADLRRLNPVIAGEDAGTILFGYSSGLCVTYDGNRLLDFDTDNARRTFGEMLVEGTGGTLFLDGSGAVRLRPFNGRSWETLLAGRDWPGFAGDCVCALQEHVVAALLDGTPLENRAGDYLRNVELEDAVYRSAAEGRRLPV